MGVAYAQDLRDRVLAAYDRGMKTKEIADIFQVSSSWARRVNQRRRETGETTHRPMGGPEVTIVDREQLAALVRQHIVVLNTMSGRDAGRTARLTRRQLCTLHALQGLEEDGLYIQKERFTQSSKTAQTSSKGGRSGSRGRRTHTPDG